MVNVEMQVTFVRATSVTLPWHLTWLTFCIYCETTPLVELNEFYEDNLLCFYNADVSGRSNVYRYDRLVATDGYCATGTLV